MLQRQVVGVVPSCGWGDQCMGRLVPGLHCLLHQKRGRLAPSLGVDYSLSLVKAARRKGVPPITLFTTGESNANVSSMRRHAQTGAPL